MKTSDLLVVGYTTELRSDMTKYMPEFSPNRGTVDVEKQLGQLQEKQERFIDEAREMPWAAQLREVCLFDTATNKMHRFKRGAAGEPDITTALAEHVAQHHEHQFGADGAFRQHPVRVIGFNVRNFAKMWGLGAAEHGVRLPHELWYGAEHRDMLEALMPRSECKSLPLAAAFDRLPFTMYSPNWQSGLNAVQDMKLAAEIALLLGLFPCFDAQLNQALLATTSRPRRKRQGVPA